MNARDPVYECPACGAVSYHPEDIKNKYCGRCHQFEVFGRLSVPQMWEKFNVGDHVKIVRLLDNITSKDRSQIEEVDDLPNGEYNYYLTDGTYVHEAELEADIPEEVIARLQEGL